MPGRLGVDNLEECAVMAEGNLIYLDIVGVEGLSTSPKSLNNKPFWLHYFFNLMLLMYFTLSWDTDMNAVFIKTLYDRVRACFCNILFAESKRFESHF